MGVKGKRAVIEHREFDDTTASGMQRFCAKCPHMKLEFMTNWFPPFIERGEVMVGTLRAVCFSHLMTHGNEVSAALGWSDRNRIQVNGFGTCLFSLDDIPKSMRSQVVDYISRNPCIIEGRCDGCAMYTERLVSGEI